MYSSIFIYCARNLLGCFVATGVIYQVDNMSGPNEWGMELLVLNPELWKIISEGSQESKIKFFFSEGLGENDEVIFYWTKTKHEMRNAWNYN